MNTLNDYATKYLEYCEYRKNLNAKSLKAYRIDLKQYEVFCRNTAAADFISKNTVDVFITDLHKQYRPKTVKRKIASLKAFFHYMEYKVLINKNPFAKLDIRFREAKLLPKTVPFHSIQAFLCHSPDETRYRHQVHTENARPQFNQHNRNIHACVQYKAKRFPDQQTSDNQELSFISHMNIQSL